MYATHGRCPSDSSNATAGEILIDPRDDDVVEAVVDVAPVRMDAVLIYRKLCCGISK